MVLWKKQVAKTLEYRNTREIIGRLNDDHKKIYADIKEYSKYKYKYKYNIQDHAVFINEYGLYELTFKSKMTEAKKFRKWLSSEVMPTVRKTGKYIVDDDTKKDLDILNDELIKYKKRVKILENNQRKEKYPKG